MMDETYLVEHIKEQVCFVSAALGADLAAAKAGRHRLEYVLPDGVNEQLGYARPPAARAEKRDREAASREQVRCHIRPLRSLRHHRACRAAADQAVTGIELAACDHPLLCRFGPAMRPASGERAGGAPGA